MEPARPVSRPLSFLRTALAAAALLCPTGCFTALTVFDLEHGHETRSVSATLRQERDGSLVMDWRAQNASGHASGDRGQLALDSGDLPCDDARLGSGRWYYDLRSAGMDEALDVAIVEFETADEAFRKMRNRLPPAEEAELERDMREMARRELPGDVTTPVFFEALHREVGACTRLVVLRGDGDPTELELFVETPEGIRRIAVEDGSFRWWRAGLLPLSLAADVATSPWQLGVWLLAAATWNIEP